MKSLKVVLVAIMLLTSYLTLTACQVASPLEDYTWVMTSYSEAGKTISALPGTEVTAFFNSKDKTLSGSGGCNTYGGKYNLDRLTLTFPEPLIMTLMACSDEINAQETEYLKLLQGAQSFEMDHGNLMIQCGKQMLFFKRK